MVKRVKHVTSVGRNGIHDFILIRATALILTVYTLYLFNFFVFSDINYFSWVAFFKLTSTKVFTMLALISVLIHGWIGMWQVLTDYVKCAKLRAGLQLVVVVALLSYLFSGLFILWGV